MTVENPEVIDFVAHDPSEDMVILVMVEVREWGNSGELLPDLQKKLNTYYAYATAGHLGDDYPAFAGKKVRIELRSSFEPGERERNFLRIVLTRHLEPARIGLICKVIGSSATFAL